MSTHRMTVTLGDDETSGERTYEVRYSFLRGCPAKISGPPEHCYPAEPDEIDIIKVEPSVESTIMHMGAFADIAYRDEYERIEDYLYEHHEDTYEAERDACLEDRADEARHEGRFQP